MAWSAWFHEWDLVTCEAEALRAIELNPSDERAHELYSFFLLFTRADRPRAFSEFKLAWDLDPLSQRANFYAASLYLFVDDYEQALEQASRNLDLFGPSFHSFGTIGLAELCRNRYAEAIAALEKAAAISASAFSHAYLGSALARAGQEAKARQLLHDLLCRSEREHVAPRCFVYIYASLGEMDRAFDWLERAFEARDPGLFALRVMPLYDPLHSDLRVERMLERIGVVGGVHDRID